MISGAADDDPSGIGSIGVRAYRYGDRARASIYALICGIGITLATIFLSYRQIAKGLEIHTGLHRTNSGRHWLPSSARQSGHTLRMWTRRYDVILGTFFSNLVMFFIIVASAFTLGRSGVTNIETSLEAAKGLEPIAGRF